MKLSDLNDRALLEKLLQEHGGVKPLARALGCTPPGVYHYCLKHGLTSPISRGSHTRPKAEVAPTTDQAIDAEKTRLKAQWDRQLLQDLKRRSAINELIVDALKAAIGQIEYSPAPIAVTTVSPEYMRQHDEEEVAVLVLSDTQIGQVTPAYDSEVFTHRMDLLAAHVEKLVNLHRSNYRIDRLVILGAGDFVENENIFPGQAHCIDQGVLEQVFRTGVPAFARFGQRMSALFSRVDWNMVPGNHGSNGRHAAPSTNWDRVFALTLELALQNVPNMTFTHAALHDFYLVVDVLGHRFLLIHGDEIPIWMNIPFYGIERSSSRWAQSIPRWPWDYLVMGHFHTSNWLKMNAKKIIMNGAFPTDSPYVLKRLKLDSTEPVQWLFGVHERRGVSWRYEIDLRG